MVSQLRLAATLGCTLNEMKARITPYEFQLWEAYFQVEPPAGQRLDFHFAQTQALMANLTPKKRKTKTFKLTDFYVDFHKVFADRVSRRAQSAKDVASSLMTWAFSNGAKVKNSKKGESK